MSRFPSRDPRRGSVKINKTDLSASDPAPRLAPVTRRRRKRSICLAGLLAISTVSRAIASASAPAAATTDITSYAVPEGFETMDVGAIANRANYRRIDPDNWILIAVYGSRASSGDLTAEFAFDWKDVGAPNVKVAVPTPSARKVGAGIKAMEGGAQCPVGWVELVEVDAGSKVVTILFQSGSKDGFTSKYHHTVEAFLAGVALSTGAKSEATSIPPLAAGKSATLTAADFVGHWYESDSSTLSYVNTSTGAYAGSSSVFYGESYDIAADGTWTSRFRGMANSHMVDEKSAGTWQLTSARVVITRENVATKYQLIGFQKFDNGSVQLDLLLESYPLTSANISLYTTHWRREKK